MKLNHTGKKTKTKTIYYSLMCDSSIIISLEAGAQFLDSRVVM